MSWWAIDVRSTPERRESIAAWLVARTGQAVEERDDGTLVTFAPDDVEADRLVASFAERGPVAATRRLLEPVDWRLRWREGLGPRQIGRLTIARSWAAAEASTRGPVVMIDPEMAFGSGEHGSTRSALALLERHLRAGDRVLDLGSGSGIVALAAVALGARRAVGIERDPVANEVALRNADRNGVAGRVSFVEGEAADLAPLVGPAEVLVSNILRNINTRLLPSIRAAVPPGGLAIFAGMEAAEAEIFRPVLAGAGFSPVDDAIDAGWWAVAARRE